MALEPQECGRQSLPAPTPTGAAGKGGGNVPRAQDPEALILERTSGMQGGLRRPETKLLALQTPESSLRS